MKLIQVILAQSIAAVTPNHGFGYLPDALSAVLGRYKFVDFPSQPHQFFPADSNDPINFRHGKIEIGGKTIVIAWLQIFQSGVAISTDSDTKDSDLVLDDVLDWAASRFNLEFKIVRPGFGHLSQIVVQLERNLSDYFPALKPVLADVQSKLDDFYTAKPAYELTSLLFHFDQSIHPSLAPNGIRLEPRAGVPFDQRLYYSEAPLSTENHLELIQRIEAALSR